MISIEDTSRFFYVPTGLLFFSRYLTGTALPIFIVRDLGKSATMAGLVVAMIGLGKMMMDIPAGALIKATGFSIAFSVAALLMGGASLLMALFPDLAVIFISMPLFGMGMAVFQVGRQELLVNSVSPEMRSRVAAYVGAVSRFGTIFAPVIGAFIFDLSGGVRLLFLIQGALACASVAGLSGEDYAAIGLQKDTQATPHMTVSEIVKKFKSPLFTSGVFINGLQILRESRRLVLPIAGHRLGWTVEAISILLSVSYAVDFATCFLADRLFAAKGLKFASWTTVALFCLSLLSLGLSEFNNAFLWIGGILAGIANGSASGISLLLGSEIAPPSCGPMFSSVWRLITDTGEFLGPIITGVLIDAFPLPIALLVVAGIGISGAFVYAGSDLKDFANAIGLLTVTNVDPEQVNYRMVAVGKSPIVSIESSPTGTIHK